jgi:hypothetical protein
VIKSLLVVPDGNTMTRIQARTTRGLSRERGCTLSFFPRSCIFWIGRGPGERRRERTSRRIPESPGHQCILCGRQPRRGIELRGLTLAVILILLGGMDRSMAQGGKECPEWPSGARFCIKMGAVEQASICPGIHPRVGRVSCDKE